MKIKEIYLFTNRSSIFFDENGEQIADLQPTVAWKPIPSYDDYKVTKMLERVIEDKPAIYIARWQEWKHKITLDEFCCLIGYGPWYWDHKNYVNEE